MKSVHFIGICGVGMAGVAVMMQKMGWKVCGSDKGFFPPISDFLKKNKIDFYPGWHPEKISNPDIIVVGNFISLNNPEYLFVKKKKLVIKSYPELVREYIVKKKSVVVAGTFGKTTIAAFVAHLFKIAGLNPSWFIGGLAKNFSCGAANNQDNWSVAEGDEYTTARWDSRSKFLLYKPTHLILTSILWDHLDVFPREKDYDRAFKKLIKIIPSQGVIIAAKRNDTQKIDKIISQSRAKIIRYGPHEVKSYKTDYSYEITSLNKNGSEFVVYHSASSRLSGRQIKGKPQTDNRQTADGPASSADKQNKILGKFKTNLLGEHLVENLLAGIALANENKIDLKVIQKAVESFQGVKRRLEIRNNSLRQSANNENQIKIIDDLAHSPSKAKASLKALRAHFPQAKIFAIFEPNVGNRTVSSKNLYQNAFIDANTVIIPRLSQTKTDEKQEPRMEGKELAKIIEQKNKGIKVLYLEDDENLVNFLIKETRAKDIIIFLGSHGFRGIIEETMLQVSKF